MPAPTPETPRYRTGRDMFIAPLHITAGSVIEFAGSPADHFIPQNQSAADAMEAWYNEEMEELDNNGEPTGKKFKPHAKYRRKHIVPGVHTHEATVVSGPKPLIIQDGTTLAEALMVKPASTDFQAPPPATAPDPDDFTAPNPVAVVSTPPKKEPGR